MAPNRLFKYQEESLQLVYESMHVPKRLLEMPTHSRDQPTIAPIEFDLQHEPQLRKPKMNRASRYINMLLAVCGGISAAAHGTQITSALAKTVELPQHIQDMKQDDALSKRERKNAKRLRDGAVQMVVRHEV